MPIAPIQAACFAERMLNPFRGICNVVEIQGADAVSRDGERWTLFVHGECEEALVEDGSIQEVETPDVKWATWSAEHGLRRAPVRRVIDHVFIDVIGGQLLEAVMTYGQDVPFPLRDCFEMWLLDRREQPLALVASSCDRSELEDPTTLQWRAGQLACRGFHARSRTEDDRPHSELVADLIAGAAHGAGWFRREPDGSGSPLGGGRHLPRGAFPELLLKTSWPDPAAAALVRDFLDWQAPWLLQLQDLSFPTRAGLELAAGRRALELAERHRLYPEVVEQSQVAAALVEARLRRSAEPPPEVVAEPDPLFPFFNE